MNKQSGFTLIELVIVVVILGFLAVTAIPKFLDLTDQAKQANIEGMAGGFATAVSLVRAQWEAEGRPQNTTGQNIVDYDGTDLILTIQATDIRPGYVVSSNTVSQNNGATLGSDFTATNCVDIWQSIFQQPPRLTDSISILNTDSSLNYLAVKSGSAATTLCHFYLKETLSKDVNNDFAEPIASALTSTGNSFTYQPADSSVVVYINNNNK
ncbi:prepilin-type N-terminal cleavage/methylation domain-containing protein [Colwellia sp. MB02u-6]|uniref:type II secretion system protein n=1 Tax=Colwellia sp. MB02u-6 TaxID=2759824 RepID=UPI0015F64676|nr:prepilin-type N-terminal cleavage/methylation domain-containing protein [Colwellia sp. MB02u-6]MBA6329110.1 prepilin-type N-terminal cleavage/methylation domain-containing protein [Colwellia sp. MB02u-6]